MVLLQKCNVSFLVPGPDYNDHQGLGEYMVLIYVQVRGLRYDRLRYSLIRFHCVSYYTYTIVKLVYNNHPGDEVMVVFVDRWLL